jgi:NAD(P)-dependent dehydrogenase (short-subunit alcohol dehydrogenase family)
MTGPLSGQAMFITGAAKGMGRAITLELAQSGADIVCAGRDIAAMDPVAAEIRAMGRDAMVVSCDVSDETSVSAAVATAWAGFSPKVWGLVNIAGGTGPSGKLLWEHDLAEVYEVFDVNLIGPFLTMKHMLPHMNAMGTGAVDNIGGTFGFKGVRKSSAYGATKWALRGLTKSAALEAGAFGVRVNMVSPGGVDGPRLMRQLGEAAVREGITAEESYARFCTTAALGRMSTDQDVALAVQFLLGPGGRNITGQDILVDGGTIL